MEDEPRKLTDIKILDIRIVADPLPGYEFEEPRCVCRPSAKCAYCMQRDGQI